MAVDVKTLLDDAVVILESSGLRWAVMGGCARNAYAEPRATKDVDFVVEADLDGFRRLHDALTRRGFSRASSVVSEGETLPDLVLYRDAEGRRVDLLLAHTEFERSALDRRRELSPFEGSEVQVISAEDLIVYKLIANRAQDRADIEAVVEAERLRGDPIDWGYVESWCEAWEVLDRLNTLRAALSTRG